MNKRYNLMLLIVLVCLVLGSGLWWASGRIQDQAPPPLAELALQPEDLSKNALWLSVGATDLDDISQPLNSHNLINNPALDAATLLAYDDAYKAEIVEMDDTGSTVAVTANYLYQYADRRHAQIAARQVVGLLMQADGSQASADVATGETVRISQADGMASYWWVDADGQTLSLLRVEGSSAQTTEQVFAETVAQASGKKAR
ncbi:MAG: hypothetical protein IAE85_15570 [Anaerolinea sp.]|jgi:hypothetical protein|nr:hypothetical protein [Anaerolinea sp.]